jgi:beta-lactamase regulating signal transducer with metallopeptidase domain
MNPFFEYLLKSSAGIALFYVVFKLAISNEKMHSVNRFVLLGILLVSAIVPFADFPVFGKTEIITIPKVEAVSEVAAPPVFVAPETTPVFDAIQPDIQSEPIQINWLLVFYLLAVSLLVLRLIISMVKVVLIVGNAEKQRFRKIILAIAKEFIQPFSFLKYIVISEKDYTENRDIVVAHEQAHIQNYHSVDLIICELFTLLHWFNPFMWLLRHDLKLIHEFQADQAVLNRGIDAKKYQLLVLQKSVGERRFAMANHFTQKPILKRLKMMQKRDRKKWNTLKLIVFIPIVLLLLQAFAKPDIIIKNATETTAGFVQQTETEQTKNGLSIEEKSAATMPIIPVNELPNKSDETKVKKEFNKQEEDFRKAEVEATNIVREKKTAENGGVSLRIRPESDIAKACTVTLSDDLLFVDNKQTTFHELKMVVEQMIEQSKNINTVELQVFEGTSESRIENVNGILNRISGVKRIKKIILPQAPPPIYISINSSGELKVGNDRFTSYDEFEDRLIEIERSVKKEYKTSGGTQYLVANVKVKAGVTNSEVSRLKESLRKAKLQHVNYFQEKIGLKNSNCKTEYFGNGLIKTLGKNGKIGLATKSGNQILATEYDEIEFYGNYIKTYKDGKYGLCSTSGNILFRNEYSDISMYGNYIRTVKDSKYGLYSKSGNVLLRNEYSDISMYGNYIRTVKDSKYGLYSKSGNVILKNEYDDISLADSYLKTVKNGKAGLTDSRGIILIPNEYDKLEVNGKKVRLVKNGTKKTITL